MRSARSTILPERSRPRVVLVTPGFSANEADWCIPILRDLAECLAHRAEISIVTLRYPSPRRRYAVAGIPVVAVGGGQRRGITRVGLMWRAVAAVRSEARRTSADLIHGFWAHEPGTVACIAGRLTGRPVVVTLMGGELTRLPKIRYGGELSTVNRLMTRFSLAGADRVVAISGFLEDAASKTVESCRLRRLDLGVRTDRFRPTDTVRNSDETRFLMVGSLVPVKGHEVVLHAFSRCRHKIPKARLDIVGEGPLREHLETVSARLELGDSIRFVGPIDHLDLPETYRRADVLVVASWWEGASQVAHEAVACGLPIVSTAVGLPPEFGDAALCVPVGDANGLGCAMATVATDPDLRARMARSTAGAVRPIDTCASGLIGLYEELIRSGSVRRRL